MQLATPNAERASLEKWIALSRTPAEPDGQRALRCLARYVPARLRPADVDWAAWYQKQKDRIVFIESTGFWWQEDPRVLASERDAKAK